MIETHALGPEGEIHLVVEAECTGDLLAQQRGQASGAYRRKYQAWPDTFYQEVDGEPAYPYEKLRRGATSS